MKKFAEFLASDNVTAFVALCSIVWGVSFLWYWFTKPKLTYLRPGESGEVLRGGKFQLPPHEKP